MLVQNLINYLQETTEHRIILFAPNYGDKLPEIEHTDRLTIHRFFNPDNKLSVVRGLFQFTKLLKQEKPDLVHGQDFLIDGFFCRFSCPKLGIPYLLSTQGELNPLKREIVPWSTKIKTPYLRWILNPCRVVITPEPKIHSKLKNLLGNEEKFSLISNAIYITSEQKSPSKNDDSRLKELGLRSGSFFLFLGRIVKEKGVYEILESVKALAETFRQHDFRFFFSGEGAAKADLELIAQKTGIQDLILFSSDIQPDDKWILLRHCRSMVLPSWEENLPISILESLGLEKGIIGSDLPEIMALLPTKTVGKTFELKNSQDLARSLSEDITSAAEPATEDFNKAMAPYDLRQMGKVLLNLYEGIAGS